MKPVKSNGFTLIEVLVSLAILLFGLLGIAGLMVKGQRASFEAYQRQQALALAQDMAERIRSNPAGGATYAAVGAAEATNMGHGTQVAPKNCSTTNCNAAEIAGYDLQAWDQSLVGSSETLGGNKVGGIINPRGCIEQVGAISRYTISVSWQGDASTAGPGDGAGEVSVVACKNAASPPGNVNVPTTTCGQGLYKDSKGIVNNKNRRVVSLCVGTLQAQAGAGGS